jgi:hypothetical protein
MINAGVDAATNPGLLNPRRLLAVRGQLLFARASLHPIIFGGRGYENLCPVVPEVDRRPLVPSGVQFSRGEPSGRQSFQAGSLKLTSRCRICVRAEFGNGLLDEPFLGLSVSAKRVLIVLLLRCLDLHLKLLAFALHLAITTIELGEARLLVRAQLGDVLECPNARHLALQRTNQPLRDAVDRTFILTGSCQHLFPLGVCPLPQNIRPLLKGSLCGLDELGSLLLDGAVKVSRVDGLASL